MQDVALRDRRKPGHCWQDNELYDAFGPVIGPFAMLVYTQLTRHCYGDGGIRTTCRELAEAIGISKDSVHRALGVMELVGMLRRIELKKTSGGRVSEYHLVDLKELAMRYGGTLDPKRFSFTLSQSQTSSLIADVKEYLRNFKRKKFVSQGDKTVPPSPLLFVSQGDKFVSPTDVFVSLAGQASSIGQNTIHQDIPSPTPSVPEGDASRAGRLPSLISKPDTELFAREVDRVVQACSFDDRRVRAAIASALEAYLAAGKGRDPTTTAQAMIASWRAYCGYGDCLRFTWGPKKFFAQGHWVNQDGWPLDEAERERRRMRADASFGTYRPS